MNWSRVILDGLAMAAYFNLFATVIVLVDPRLMMSGYPRSIQKAAPLPQTGRERRIYLLWMYFGMLLPLTVYGSLSQVNGGIAGFQSLFRAAYAQWLIIGFSDFFLLDILLLQKLGLRARIPGTEEHEDYRLGNWLKKLAVPEHFLGWPLVVAPVLSVIQAGLGLLWGKMG